MPNPTIHQHQAEPAPPAKNGVLARVGGDLIGQGMQKLPPAGPAEGAKPLREMVMEVPDLGMVRITYELDSYKRGRSRHWHWRVVRADVVGGR